MSDDVLNFIVPVGYRLVRAEAPATVECERGCGWQLRLATLSALPTEARDQLFGCHEDWHKKVRADE
jgi:hypothetical protein